MIIHSKMTIHINRRSHGNGAGQNGKAMRIMSATPLNAETPKEHLRSWITVNSVFFDRNQGTLMEAPIDIYQWRLTVTGEVEKELLFTFNDILRMPKAILANTLECSGNGRSLLKEKTGGNGP